MKIVVLYRPGSAHARLAVDFIRDFQHFHSTVTVQTVNLDTRDGASMATLYDITAYPAILALEQNGGMLQMWQGEQLPLMDEVASYMQTA